MNPQSLIEAAQQVLDALDTLKIALRVGMPEYGAEDQDELLEAAIAAQRSMLSMLQEPVYSIENLDKAYELGFSEGVKAAPNPAKREPLTPRELELIDGMIEVQLNHAERCDAIANRRIAAKQKEWDMERVELLRKIRAHGIGEQE